LAYIDYSSQEVAIAAALSGDPALIDAVASGDPYLAFAVRAGLAPSDASKETHAHVRDRCKACVLGVNYGMGAATLALRIGGHRLDAEHLLQLLVRSFPIFTRWTEAIADAAELSGYMTSVFGWPLHVTPTTRATSLRNFPMQANGAEMLRLACCMATEAGVMVDAPVHDALLIEAADTEVSEAVALTRSAMAEASRIVLGGMQVNTDVKVISWPERFTDPRGQSMWDRVVALLNGDPSKVAKVG
jgi:DNA polymerase I-like protein with 3'-5' exonuclease and polymerase domains